MMEPAPAPVRPPTHIEALLRQDRTRGIVLVVLLSVVCWAWIVVMARDMYGPMTGASAWMMTPVWDARHLFLLWAMWAVMMTAMMLPSASPLLLLYGGAARRRSGESGVRQVYALAGGYLFVWALFSVMATALQRLLALLWLLSPMMEPASRLLGPALLIIAGIYQLTPVKRACLRTCQSPLGFLMGHWRAGTAGAFRMGVEHGAYCVGCCWAVMLLLFAGGVMNLAVIAALTVFVAFEKLAPLGAQGARVSGALLVLAGISMLVLAES
jgi:predicted metal-binding membrane protein